MSLCHTSMMTDDVKYLSRYYKYKAIDLVRKFSELLIKSCQLRIYVTVIRGYFGMIILNRIFLNRINKLDPGVDLPRI